MKNIKRGLNPTRCPKCGGNCYMDIDTHGWYVFCLQCGYNRDLPVHMAPVAIKTDQ